MDDEKEVEKVVVLPTKETKQTESEEEVTIRPEISILINEDTTTLPLGVWSLRDRYCWENADKQCSLEPTPLKELLEHERTTKVEPGDILTFKFRAPNDDLHFPKPDSFIIYIDEDGELKEEEIVGNQLQVPMQEGRYYMAVKMIWDGDVKGEAIYGFQLLVKHEAESP